ncbi:MAG: phosphatase PAP2 family protein [candidate division Zixibacteria bacterium]|nr:phosphatase PAP2 family protein [candidate division Zixibacteria bacterium]
MNISLKKLYPFDWLIIGYSSLMILLISILGKPFSQYFDEILFYSSMIIIAFLISNLIDENKNRFMALIRFLYPVFLFTFFYNATGGTMFLIFDKFLDYQLVAFEKSLLGLNLTLYIDQNLLSVIPNEIFSFCYFCYYFMIPVYFIWLFIRKDDDILKESVTAICLTFFFSYLLFFLYPIEGPRYYFVDLFQNKIEGPIFRQLVEYIILNGAVRGGCMPSTHFAVALVINMFCFKYYRLFAWILLPINIGMAIGTFWGRFHYVSDVIIGCIIGILGTVFVWKYYNLLVNNKELNTEL